MASPFILAFLSFLLQTSASFPLQPLCHDDESSALLQLKSSFVLDRYASISSFSYPKTRSWKQQGHHTDCCSWDGVECDAETGHVIGLDLSSSWLYGSISSNSSLFHLVHLRRLNLADNHFSYSGIPHEIGQLTALSYLNLSHSAFYGQVPHAISKLSRLASLDLSHNVYNDYPLLELGKPNLRKLVKNLTALQELHLSFVHMPSSPPQLLANLTSLNSLILDNCGLQGTFPPEIFHLPKLQVLNVERNGNLTGQLPEFLSSSRLQTFRLASTSFFGSLPASVGNLNILTKMDVSASAFWGPIPSSLGNLTKLNYLNLAANNFIGPIPSSLANLKEVIDLSFAENNLSQESFSWLTGHPKLARLNLESANLVGGFPTTLRNLTQLTSLNLEYNKFTGLIPSWLPNVTQLVRLNLNGNQFHGPVPRSICRLYNLQFLFLYNNNLAGTLEVETFFNLTKLKGLDLGYNHLSLLTQTETNTTSKLTFLGLGACNLREFPGFIQNQDALKILDLSSNNIHGKIPEWIWKASRRINVIGLGNNVLTGSINSSLLAQLTNLEVLLLDDNKLQGTLPIPSSFLYVYSASNNTLSGVVSPSICNLHALNILDLSHNNFSGSLPECLGNSSSYIQVLNLQNNSFVGTIPWLFAQGNWLRMIDLSHNQLTGQIPRSMVRCLMLQKLDLSNNQVNDVFPSWLGGLSKLQVLGLRANKLYGEMGNPMNFSFPALRIIDLSHNELTGNLQSKYFENWYGMKGVQQDQLSYVTVAINLHFDGQTFFDEQTFMLTISLTYAMDLGIKGTYIQHMPILESMVAVDLSKNKFEGQIPESIGGLKALILLNVSNNQLSDAIPESMGNLTNLEALDLSHNMLSGPIPKQLAALSFLEFFDVSDNDLVGPIPQGTQFDTFPKSSFWGNPGLCGRPLPRLCANRTRSPGTGSMSDKDEDSDSESVIKWVIIALGFGSGVVVGVILGNIFVERNGECLMQLHGGKNRRRARLNKPMGNQDDARRREIARGKEPIV